MKKFSKIVLASFAFLMFLSIFSVGSVLAAEAPPIEVEEDTIETCIQANNRVTFTFRNRTRLTLNSTVDIDLNIECRALQIGVKYFEMEIDADHDLQMNMVCTEEQIQLGLMNGSTFRNNNRNRYLYQEGFCVMIQCNDSCQAKLKIQANHQNHDGKWAYYHENSEEWITVPTTVEDGYLVAETDHFSYWTVLIPTTENNLMIYIGIGAAVGLIAVIAVLILKKRK